MLRRQLGSLTFDASSHGLSGGPPDHIASEPDDLDLLDRPYDLPTQEPGRMRRSHGCEHLWLVFHREKKRIVPLRPAAESCSRWQMLLLLLPCVYVCSGTIHYLALRAVSGGISSLGGSKTPACRSPSHSILTCVKVSDLGKGGGGVLGAEGAGVFDRML